MLEGCKILKFPILFHREENKNFENIEILKVCSLVHEIQAFNEVLFHKIKTAS